MSDENVKYTENMEKALQQSHGIGYESYKGSLKKKVEVEKAREKDYRDSLQVENELTRKMNR
ncbi:hypothetical protein [Salipaludibacillus daqingensis]|uniref:hypothetical protein n=1 Tax=Salipaludibacillus daqingensis TaxID=3041001 RepID=UPI0024737124|nr:hypothetical protein [Salipaludibacillus daqingensis]